MGSGGHAQVYSCTFESTGARYAVKVIDLQTHSSSRDKERLESEVKILKQVNHPSCLGLEDSYRDSRYLMLVTEHLKKGELFEVVRDRKRINEVEARHIMKQVIEGLQCLHSKNIMHRDLKTENVLVAHSERSAEGDVYYTIKLCDYGLSKIVTAENQATTQVGTPQYIPPEILDLDRTGGGYDFSADIWCAGVILYVLVFGKYPFSNKAEIRRGQPDLRSFQVSKELKDLILNMLEADPRKRLAIDRILQHLGCLAMKWKNQSRINFVL